MKDAPVFSYKKDMELDIRGIRTGENEEEENALCISCTKSGKSEDSFPFLVV